MTGSENYRGYVVAIGANLGDPAATFEKALVLLADAGITIERRSRWLQTPPLSHPERPNLKQPTFLNGALRIYTLQRPMELLDTLLDIERRLGRDRSVDALRWGPRMIDLDIVSAGELILHTPVLTIPHPEMHRRLFVLEPMLEVAPEWRHPLLKKSVAELIADLRAAADGVPTP